MFQFCYALKGGAGTTHDKENPVIDGTYARLDGDNGEPGYFTNIADKPVTTSDAVRMMSIEEPPSAENADTIDLAPLLVVALASLVVVVAFRPSHS